MHHGSEVGHWKPQATIMLTSTLAPYLQAQPIPKRHWDSRERQIKTSPLSITLQTAMAEAGKIAKTLASAGRRNAQTKA